MEVNINRCRDSRRSMLKSMVSGQVFFPVYIWLPAGAQEAVGSMDVHHVQYSGSDCSGEALYLHPGWSTSKKQSVQSVTVENEHYKRSCGENVLRWHYRALLITMVLTCGSSAKTGPIILVLYRLQEGEQQVHTRCLSNDHIARHPGILGRHFLVHDLEFAIRLLASGDGRGEQKEDCLY